VVKNSLSLSAMLAAVPAAVVVFAGVVAPVVVADACSKFSTLLKAASKRVTPRFGAGVAASVLGTVLMVADVVVAALA
jgi:hypothetical protein